MARFLRPPQKDVRVGMLGVPMIHRDPLEMRAQVTFHLRHELSCERLQVPDLGGVLRGHDEAELMSIASHPFLERLRINLILRGPVELPRATFAGDTVALD